MQLIAIHPEGEDMSVERRASIKTPLLENHPVSPDKIHRDCHPSFVRRGALRNLPPRVIDTPLPIEFFPNHSFVKPFIPVDKNHFC